MALGSNGLACTLPKNSSYSSTLISPPILIPSGNLHRIPSLCFSCITWAFASWLSSTKTVRPESLSSRFFILIKILLPGKIVVSSVRSWSSHLYLIDSRGKKSRQNQTDIRWQPLEIGALRRTCKKLRVAACGFPFCRNSSKYRTYLCCDAIVTPFPSCVRRLPKNCCDTRIHTLLAGTLYLVDLNENYCSDKQCRLVQIQLILASSSNL